MQRPHARVLGAALAAALSTSALAHATPSLRVQVAQRGDAVLIGNTLGQDCVAGVPSPVVGTLGACGTNTADSAPDVFWRADAPSIGQASADTTITVEQARSTAVLALPPGASVTHAYLYWAATNETLAADTDVALERVGSGGFSASVVASASILATSGTGYEAVADVTSLVQAQGSGPYRVSGVSARALANVNDANAYAAWWMVVLYERASDPLRQLALYDGLDTVASGSSQTLTVSGFAVPTTGYGGRLGIVALDGDNTLTGDSLSFGAATLSDALNPATNVFNGTRSSAGVARSLAGDLPQLTGAPQSMSGLDLDEFELTALLFPGQRSAVLEASSTGDVFHLGTVFTSVTTAVPVLASTKSATDVDGGLTLPGDVVTFTITVTNTGTDEVASGSLTDVLPAGVTFVPDTVRLDGTLLHDVTGDDAVDYDPATQTLRVQIGALAVGATATVTFSVTVDAGTSGVVANQATWTGLGASGLVIVPALSDGDSGSDGAQPTTFLVDACATNADCAAPSPACDTDATPNVCVACVVDADCGGGLTPRCVERACTCISAGAEACNGVDDDCNGTVDDGNPEGGAVCSTGLPGVCAAGVGTCTAASLACAPTLLPGMAVETCNGLDDDCDGATDEDFAVGGACVVGVGACMRSGDVVCASESATTCDAVEGSPEAEVCGDGVDQDCDGTADEDCAPDGAVDADAGVTLGDAGAVDAGASDAGASDGGALDGGDSMASVSGGCGCRAGARGDTGAAGVGLGLVVAGWLARRRRRATQG